MARKFNAVKFVGLTENGDNRARIAGGDRRVSTAPDFVLEARLYQINHRGGFALAVDALDCGAPVFAASVTVLSEIKRSRIVMEGRTERRKERDTIEMKKRRELVSRFGQNGPRQWLLPKMFHPLHPEIRQDTKFFKLAFRFW